jgi:NNP family nitrate/nitrite transporter-like MFS transporter
MMATPAPAAGEQQVALWGSTFAFTLCFAVWTIFSIIGVQIKQELGLSDTQFGLLVATPILTGSLVRLFLGIWTDQIGGRVLFPIVMLCSAAATWLLTTMSTFGGYLFAALLVGVAGGGFIVGTAYVSKWFPKEKQGLALGIFGSGNIGAALTKLVAPLVMVAWGWHAVAHIWAGVLAVTAVLFYLFCKDDPALAARRAAGVKPESFRQQMAPLMKLQVWRFSLYYFFVLGAFIALALWLPRYLVGVYGLDIATAGLIAALYSIPGSIFRVLGGWWSDKYGARRVMYWTLGASTVCCFLLAYPSTTYVIDGIRGPIEFTLEMGVVPFTVLVFVLGFFMSLGKAAVYKHIPVYYPDHVGSVGGMVGMIGALGGFVLPIAFGVMNDWIGIWTTSFMLLFVITAVSLLWMHFAIRRMDRQRFPQIKDETDLPEIMSAAGPARGPG